jgi:VanZ family protein
MAPAGALRLPAALAAALLVTLIVYASLFPFEGWIWPPGRSATELLVLPWPRARLPFDLWSNYLGYLPLGALLALAMRRPGLPGWRGLLVALGAAALAGGLSFVLEVTQQFLPQRHPSLLDWVLNTGGAASGALLAPLLWRWGAPQRLVRGVAQWFDAGSAGALLLLVLWPVALLFPSPVPLGLGQVGPRVLPVLAGWLEGVPWAQPWHAALVAESAPVAPPGLHLLGGVSALGLLAPCLVAYVVVSPGWRRAGFAVGASLLTLAVLALSTALNFGPQHALAWVSPGAWPGLAAGLLAALLLLPVSQRMAAGLGLVVVTAGVLLVAQVPADPYFAQSLQRWEQGRFIRFHGLAQWIGWWWPFAAALWLLSRLGAASTIRR